MEWYVVTRIVGFIEERLIDSDASCGRERPETFLVDV
jgi:hypothetical protein